MTLLDIGDYGCDLLVSSIFKISQHQLVFWRVDFQFALLRLLCRVGCEDGEEDEAVLGSPHVCCALLSTLSHTASPPSLTAHLQTSQHSCAKYFSHKWRYSHPQLAWPDMVNFEKFSRCQIEFPNWELVLRVFSLVVSTGVWCGAWQPMSGCQDTLWPISC